MELRAPAGRPAAGVSAPALVRGFGSCHCQRPGRTANARRWGLQSPEIRMVEPVTCWAWRAGRPRGRRASVGESAADFFAPQLHRLYKSSFVFEQTLAQLDDQRL